MIVKCNCTRDSFGNTNGAQYQDAMYGQGMRVANYSPPPARGAQAKSRCTVCCREQPYVAA